MQVRGPGQRGVAVVLGARVPPGAGHAGAGRARGGVAPGQARAGPPTAARLHVWAAPRLPCGAAGHWLVDHFIFILWLTCHSLSSFLSSFYSSYSLGPRYIEIHRSPFTVHRSRVTDER